MQYLRCHDSRHLAHALVPYFIGFQRRVVYARKKYRRDTRKSDSSPVVKVACDN